MCVCVRVRSGIGETVPSKIDLLIFVFDYCLYPLSSLKYLYFDSRYRAKGGRDDWFLSTNTSNNGLASCSGPWALFPLAA